MNGFPLFFSPKKKRRALLSVLLTYFLDNFGLAIIFPIFTPLLIKSEHSILSFSTPDYERTILLGLLIAAFPLAQFFGASLIGQFSDKFGRKKAFFISILGTAIGYTFTALSLNAESLTGLFFSRFLTGFFAGNLTLCLAAVADLSPDDTSRTKNFSLITATGGLSFILAIALGGILSDPSLSRHFSPSFPFWLTSLLSFINLGCMILFFEETHKETRHPGLNPLQGLSNLRQGIQNKELRTLYLVNFLFMLAWIGSMQFLPTMLITSFHFTMNTVILWLIASGAIWGLSNLLINRHLAKRYYPGKILLASLLLLALSLLFAFTSTSPFSFLFFFYLASFAASLCWTNGLATVSLKAPSAIQGSILGINQSMTSVATMLSPTLCGILSALNVHLVYLFAGAVALFAFWLLSSHKS